MLFRSRISCMFKGAKKFNQPLSFNTSSVTNMDAMFWRAKKFNQPLNWNTSSVTNMTLMFCGAKAFNQSLNFDTSSVKECGGSQICIHGKIKYNCKECWW